MTNPYEQFEHQLSPDLEAIVDTAVKKAMRSKNLDVPYAKPKPEAPFGYWAEPLPTRRIRRLGG